MFLISTFSNSDLMLLTSTSIAPIIPSIISPFLFQLQKLLILLSQEKFYIRKQ
jgi:hypothetical protein